MLSSVVIIQHYFDKKRPFASGIASMGQSIASLSVGPIYTLLIYHFGWRGALIIHAGMVLQTAVLGALYRSLSLADSADSQNHAAASKGGGNLVIRVEKPQGICHKYFDMSLLKHKIFLIYVLSSIMQTYGVTTMYGHSPSRAVVNGMTRLEAALLLSTLGLFSTVSRFINSVVANLSCTNRIIQTCIATTAGGVIACLSCLSYDFKTHAIAVGLYGITTV